MHLHIDKMSQRQASSQPENVSFLFLLVIEAGYNNTNKLVLTQFSTSDVVHVPDGALVLLEDVVTLELEGGAQLSSGDAKICRKNDPLLDTLSVGRRFGVGPVNAILNSASQPAKKW